MHEQYEYPDPAVSLPSWQELGRKTSLLRVTLYIEGLQTGGTRCRPFLEKITQPIRARVGPADFERT